jgi:ParB family chromosome partitioning protein
VKKEALKQSLKLAEAETKTHRRFETIEAIVRGEGDSAPIEVSVAAAPAASSTAVLPRASASSPRASDGRALVRIPLNQLDENPYNARQLYESDLVEELAQSIATHGQKVPAVAATNPAHPRRFILVDGHYRRKALESLGMDHIECVVESAPKPADLYRLSFLLNEKRHQQTALDNALAWRKLLDGGAAAKEEDLLALTGLSWATVNRTLALLKLPEPVLARLRESPDRFGVSVAYEIYQYFTAAGEKAALELVDRVAKEDLSRRDIEQLRKKAEAGVKRKKKEVSRQHKVFYGGDLPVGVLKDWDSGRIVVDLTLKDATKREKLLGELKALVQAR